MSRSALWVNEKLQEEVRDCEGNNDIERLRNWATRYSEEEESIEKIIEKHVEKLELKSKIREISREEAEKKFYELAETR